MLTLRSATDPVWLRSAIVRWASVAAGDHHRRSHTITENLEFLHEPKVVNRKTPTIAEGVFIVQALRLTPTSELLLCEVFCDLQPLSPFKVGDEQTDNQARKPC